MKIINEINLIEEDGKDISIEKPKCMFVQNHWNYHDFIVIKIGKKSWTVHRDQLEIAIRNVSNWRLL